MSLKQARENTESVRNILTSEFWEIWNALPTKEKKKILKSVGREQTIELDYFNVNQAILIKERIMGEQNGSKEIEKIKKVTVDIDDYKSKFEKLVIDSQASIEDAESLKSQVKAAKSQANAATKLDWQRKKEKYETYRDKSKIHLTKLKKEYEEIRDRRNALMGACTAVIDGIKSKIESYQTECVRKAEEDRLAKEKKEQENLAAKEEEEKKKTIEVEGEEVKEPLQHFSKTLTAPGPPIEQTGFPTPDGKQISQEGQKRAITGEIRVELYSMEKLIGYIVRGEGAFDLVAPNTVVVAEIARENNIKVGEDIVPGLRRVG